MMAEEPKVLFESDGPLPVRVEEVRDVLRFRLGGGAGAVKVWNPPEYVGSENERVVRAPLSRIAELEGERDRAVMDAERQHGLVQRYREREDRVIEKANEKMRTALDLRGPEYEKGVGKATTETKR